MWKAPNESSFIVLFKLINTQLNSYLFLLYSFKFYQTAGEISKKILSKKCSTFYEIIAKFHYVHVLLNFLVTFHNRILSVNMYKKKGMFTNFLNRFLRNSKGFRNYRDIDRAKSQFRFHEDSRDLHATRVSWIFKGVSLNFEQLRWKSNWRRCKSFVFEFPW